MIALREPLAPRSARPAWLRAAVLLAPLAACSSDAASLEAPRRSSPPGTDASTGSPIPDGGAASPDGSATTDAGSDAATPDAGADPCEGRILCDSFEATADGAPPAAPWKLTSNNGTATVSSTRAFRGAHALKLTTTAATYQRAMITTDGAPLFPLPQNVLYGRMMVWLENAAGNNVHYNLISAAGPVPGHAGVSASYNYGGQLGTYLANYDTQGASTDCWKHSAQALPIGKWVCLAWRLNGPSNEMQLSTDGGEITDLHVTNKGEGCLGHDLADVWIAPTFAKASVGWESVQNDPGHVMYVDDVILDTKPVACP
jgi:hypothetical protein